MNYKTNTLWDRETWEALFGEAARASQSTADSVALLLKDILLATTGNRKNIEKLRNTAKDGIEWVWPFTQDHELSFKAFLYSIEGITIGGHEPVDLLKQAIAVADAHLLGDDPPEISSKSIETHDQTDNGADNNAYRNPGNDSKAGDAAREESPKRSADSTPLRKVRNKFVARKAASAGKSRSRRRTR